ncbi:aldehyde reductase [Vibrio sp. JC009]|uniref:SDR family oxidoreductase n=1 Tax=Vibrio sp. JC009 TaxID=2912314 RepID=UPI0023B00D6D|nr:aldehyde reductase [Vibrio sp. JC009]WED20539.1 aldehyde reductase [Vibrio sp. JC009]
MLNLDKTRPVLVTGATGYVAGWLVKTLLDNGLHIHAAVRNPSPDRVGYLQELADNSEGEITFFKADLLTEGSYDEAMQGCEVVYHTASPFFLDFKDPQKELVDPALKGTCNVLGSANRTESVKRVVVTSSCAAIYGDNKDAQDKPNQTLTEEHWNRSSSLEHNPYSYSKTVAEQAAWEMQKAQNRWELVTINPSFVLGPGIKPAATSESFTIVKQMGDGTMKAGLPHIGFCTVDVRDLAEAHFQAGFNPKANGRYIISGADSSFLGIAETLLDKYGDRYPIPRRRLPKFLIWLVGPMNGMSRKFVSNNVNYDLKADNSKSKRELGIIYRPLKETMEDFFQQLIDNRVFEK